MQLNRIVIRNTRIIKELEFTPGPGINYFVGNNGAGKTSVLEGMHVLSNGTSFRTRSPAKLIRHEERALQVFSEFTNRATDKVHSIGVQRERSGETHIRIDGEHARRLSDLTRTLPLLALHPESHQLVSGGPTLRRKLVDWGVFHVEHSFIDTWKEYRRALDQRNAALKQGAKTESVCSWDGVLASSGEILHEFRRAYIDTLEPILRLLLDRVEWGSEISLSLRRGWNEEKSLREELDNSLAKDRMYRTTHSGPHRAELIIKHRDQEIRSTFSRGQQKLFVYMFRLAQADHIANIRNIRSIFLCDDLPAELDHSRRALVCKQLVESGCQVFATSVEHLSKEFEDLGSRVFHVEHGSLRQVV